jgi:hypothetical protein
MFWAKVSRLGGFTFFYGNKCFIGIKNPFIKIRDSVVWPWIALHIYQVTWGIYTHRSRELTTKRVESRVVEIIMENNYFSLEATYYWLLFLSLVKKIGTQRWLTMNVVKQVISNKDWCLWKRHVSKR